MKNNHSFLILFGLILFLTNDLLSQTGSPLEGCSPLQVSFMAPAGATSFFWDFQDNATSTMANPENTFVEPGTYVVEFSETAGGPVIGTVTVTVFPTPELDIAADPTGGCSPLTVNFQSNSTIDPNIMVDDYLWVFGDGGIANNTTTPTHTYTSPGLYTVSLSIETNFESCNVTQIFTDLIDVSTIPGVGFVTDPNPPVSCTAPLTVSFNNTTPNPQDYTFEWDFGNGQTFSGPSPGAQTFDMDSLYTVTLTATDNSGCSGNFSMPVSVGSPVANFIIPDTVCIDVPYIVKNQSAQGSYQWDFGPNAIPPTSIEVDSVEVVFTAAGFQDITLTVSSPAGCMGDTTITVYVDQPDASYTAAPEYSCVEPLVVNFDPNSTEAVGWFWQFGDVGNSTSTDENPTFEFFNEDVTIYSINGELMFINFLTVTNPSGCTAIFEDTVYLNEPNALFMPDVASGCAPLTVTLSDSSTSAEPFVLWEWDYGDGQTASFSNNDPHQHTFTDPGEYDVQLIVTNAAGCTDTSYLLTIEVGDQITPDFSVDLTEICPGDSVQFTNLTPPDNVDAWHFTTDNDRSFHCYDEPDLTWTFDQETGPMDVTLTVEYNGCFTSVTQNDLITVKGPIAKIDYLVDCETPFDIAFTDQSMDATSLTWDFGDSTTSTLSQLVHTYDTTGVYWVTLTAENNTSGCPASVDSMQVHVRDIESAFELDTILCVGTPYFLDATTSTDVHADCWRGYTWYFTFQRPITTQDEVIDMMFPPGDHTVTLITRDINGCTDTSDLDVRAFSSMPSFTVDDDRICLPADVSFTDFSTADTTIVSWDWSFGDGGTSSDQNPTHTYTTPPPLGLDSFLVTLTTTDAVDCPASFTQWIQVYEPISTITTFPLPNLCEGDEIQFVASDFTQEGSNLTFMWDFGNGETDTGISSSTIYDSGGTYNVVLSYEEVATGCQNTTTQIVNVQDYPEADFTSNMDGMSIICYPFNALFTDNSVSTSPLFYQWDFGNGQMATAANPGASFGKGTFEVQLITSTSFGCSDTTSNTYTLIGPEGDFILDPETICKGDEVTFTMIDTVDISSFSWDFGDGVIVDGVNPVTHQYNDIPPSGQTIVTLILRSANDACTVPIEQPLFFHDVTADFVANDGIDTTGCAGEAFVFTNNSTGADVFDWDFGNGTTSTQENPTNVYNEPGNYEVALAVESSQFGCTDEIVKSITIYALPNTAVADDIICQDSMAILSVANPSAGSTYTWMPGNLLDDTIGSTVTTLSLTDAAIFSVTEVDANGCTDTDELTVEVISTIPSIEWDTAVCPGSTILLPVAVDTNYTYSWTPPIDCEGCPFNQVPNIQESDEYTLEAEDQFGLGCPTEASTYIIQLIDEAFAMPNAFTPDGDEINDFFNIITTADVPFEEIVEEFKIWNRWGQLVYDNQTPDTGWNGLDGDQPAALDVYIYSVKVSIEGCPAVEDTGEVTLIR